MDHESGDIVTLDCEDKFLNAWDIWDELSPEAKAEFKTHADFAEARARLTHWAFVNGGYTLDDLDGGAGVQEQILNKRNTLGAVIVVSILGISTLAGYYFIRKRPKEEII